MDKNKVLQALERQNLDLVTEFCKAWEQKDVEKLIPYLSEDIDYHIWEGGAEIHGVQEFRDVIGPFLAGAERVEWEIFRSHAIGVTVINERYDHFYRDGEESDWHFPVTGVFIVKDRKIVFWRDYTIPGKPARM
jgi:limonene-1,2-epoxide hydrolase